MIKQLNSIPSEIIILIFEFLSVEDCLTLEESNKQLFERLEIKDGFWSKKLFEMHIQCPSKTINILKFSQIKVSYYIPTSFEFDRFTQAKSFWKELMNGQKYLTQSLGETKENERVCSFAKRIVSTLSNPSLPSILLKRENQHLPTSSSFENFLAELHFDVYRPPRFDDKDYQFIEDVCINISQEAGGICKKEGGKRLNILSGIQGLVQSHCKIIKNYLLSLTEDIIVLKEYKRCWKEFTYSIIEMNDILKPFEDLMRSSNTTTQEQDEGVCQIIFSTWKLMVAIWIEEVYNHLSSKILSSFQRVFINTIFQSLTRSRQLFHGPKMTSLCFQNNEPHKTGNIQKMKKLLLKVFISLSDISLCRSDCDISIDNPMIEMIPKLRLMKLISPELDKLMRVMFTENERKEGQLSGVFADIQSIFNSIFNDEMFLEEKITKHVIQNKDINDTNCNKVRESVEGIAGKYKIVFRCKWENKLSPLFPSLWTI